MNEKTYTPDCWVIIHIKTENDPHYKVLAGWAESYLYGSSWKMNSGITDIKHKDGYYYIEGYTGSVYQCHEKGEGIRMSIAGVYETLKNKYDDLVELVKIEDVNPELFLKRDE